ncbi:hypothetical protein [Peptoniphilus sp. HMSC062D09]|nr:hypothetical protein [Peptoniphilus sp. HMSC062D09]
MFTDKEKTIKIIENSIEKSLVYANEGEIATYRCSTSQWWQRFGK